ncbi:MAG TPA: hypothetical protein VLX92_26675 [Kofleriaceae bacterium]|nr:hypothetical protein [Kofleriaceae bacterium]
MPTAQTFIDIEELPAPARASLARAVNDRQTPLAKTSGGGYILWWALGIATLLYGVINGFGSPYSAAQEPFQLFWYVIGFGSIGLGIVSYRAGKTLRKLLGFRPGVYAVGSRMVDARKRKLGVVELLDAQPQIVHRHVNGRYQKSTLGWHGHVFTFHQQGLPGMALEQVRATFNALQAAAQADDLDKLLALDPMTLGLALHKSAQEEAHKRGDRPKAAPNDSRAPLLVVLGATAVLSPGVWLLRNYLSVESAFSNITSSYQVDAWVASGGDAARGHRKKMELEMQEAVRDSSDHADKLRDVLAKYPDAPAAIKKPVEDALKRRYETTRKAALGLSASEQLTWFINQVYDRLEATGAKAVMQVKVKATDNSGLQKLDAIFAADKKLSKRVVPVAKYFATADEAARTERLGTAIQSGLAQFFPEDVMTFTKDETKDAPSIEIYYLIRPKILEDGSPSIYSEIDKAGRPVPNSLEYPGIEFELGATLVVPGAPGEPHQVKFSAEPAPTISVQTSVPSMPGALEEDPALAADNSAVYHAMSESAFADLQGKLVVALGGKAQPRKHVAADDGSADDGADAADSTDGADSDNAEPTAPECAALENDIKSYMGCKTAKDADRQKVIDAVKKLTGDKSMDLVAVCRKADAVVAAAIKKAGCH